MEEPRHHTHKLLHRLSKLSWPKIIVIVFLTILFFFFIIDALTTHYSITYTSELMNSLDQINVVLMTIAFISLTTIAVILCFPTGILCLSGGYLYSNKIDFLWGSIVATIVNLIGNTLGAGICFYISIYLSSTENERMSKEDFHPILWGIRNALHKEGLSINILLRLAPIVPSAMSNYGLYVLGSSFNDFIIGAFVGTVPYALALSLCGAMLTDTSEIEDFMLETSLWITVPLLLITVASVTMGTYLVYKYVDASLQAIAKENKESGNASNCETASKKVDEKTPLISESSAEDTIDDRDML